MASIILKHDGVTGYGDELARVAAGLRDGRLVIFPTETVYGIGASAALPEAIARLRAAKGRDGHKPFTIHLGQPSDAGLFVSSAPAIARRLARKSWPGPLTLLCKAAPDPHGPAAQRWPTMPLGEVYHDGMIGLRCPDSAAARELIIGSQSPIVASSANRAGMPPPTDADSAIRELGEAADFAIDGGKCRYGSSSTIVEVGQRGWKLVRAGVLDDRMVNRLATSAVLFVCTGNSCRSPMAEYLFREALAKKLGLPPADLPDHGYVVSSAGSFAMSGGRISRGSSDELARRGIDAREHRSSMLTVDLVQRAERIYTMSEDHRDAVLDLVPSAAGRVQLLDPAGGVADPVGQGPDDYRRCADQIERAVQARVQEFFDEDQHW